MKRSQLVESVLIATDGTYSFTDVIPYGDWRCNQVTEPQPDRGWFVV